MDYEPIIESISKLIGATGKVVEEGKAVEGITGKGVVRGGTPHSPVDVERWLGPLSAPEQQVPLLHDYLRGHAALQEAQQTGAPHVRDISVPVWASAQKALQSKIDADPEAQEALKNIFIGINTPKDAAVTTTKAKSLGAPPPIQSVEVPADTPTMPQAKTPKVKPSLDAVASKQRADAWNEFGVAVESQDEPRTDAALERLRGLHDAETPDAMGKPAPWEQALNYMAGLEQQVQTWQAAKLPNEAWSQAVQQFKHQQGIDAVPLPKYIRSTVDRFEAWADAQKPPTMADRFTQAIGVPRAIMSSGDLSAPGRQGLLMISRPEYWQNLLPMVEALNPEKFAESQAYIRNHPDFPSATEAGLALTDIHSKLAPKEEAFQSQLAERIPILGRIVKASEQAYTTFLNRLRLDVFSNSMKEAEAAGVDPTDLGFRKDLAEWINTSTGRGGRDFNPGVLSTILFSPRLAISRLQTFNPFYYAKLNPFVRMQALKTNIAAAAVVYSLVELAKLSGARVTWDFRNPDAGKVRIGNTRLDFGGGHFQFMRLFWQLATHQKVNSDTGKVTNLGEKFGVPTGLDLVQNFIVSKEAPVASFVTDMWRGKDQAGHKFDLSHEIIERVLPLSFQDTLDALNDQGVQGLIYAVPAIFGVGLQTYAPNPQKAKIRMNNVTGNVPPENAAAYVKMIEQADSVATVKAVERSANLSPVAREAVLKNYIRAERLKARIGWIRANQDSFRTVRQQGRKEFQMVAPGAQ